MKRHSIFQWVILPVLFITMTLTLSANSPWIYVGTYTGGESEGIYQYEMDSETGALKRLNVTGGIKNPSFLAIHPNGRFLYAVSEIGEFQGKPGGALAAYAIDPVSGHLKLLNMQSTLGGGPCHLTVDPTGSCVMVANYGGGSISAYRIQSDGSLSESTAFIQHEGSSVNANRQKEPHAHSIDVAPKGGHVYVSDLGLDKVMIYRLDPSNGSLTPNQPAFVLSEPGSGPRHLTIHSSGKYVFGINELNSTVTAYSRDGSNGGLKPIQTLSTMPSGFEGGNSTAEIFLSPDGRHLYGSNRGHDSIVVYSVDPTLGRLTWVENEPTQGRTPRSFGLDPSGRYLLAANQNSHSIVVFKRDQATGQLTSTGIRVDVPSPVCVQFLSRP